MSILTTMKGTDLSVHFSVVIPTYARPEPLQRCLQALAQLDFDFSRFEVIVVDDGSPSPAEPGHCGPMNVRVLYQTNAGPGAARNHGARNARGDYLIFIDDDCLVVPDFLKNYQQALASRPNALWGGPVMAHPSLNSCCRAAQAVSNMVYWHFNSKAESARFFSSNNMAISRAQFQSYQGFEERYFRHSSEDREFCDRLRHLGCGLALSHSAMVYHQPTMSLLAYLRMFFRYGRGAYRFQRIRKLRGSGRIQEDMSFHLCLPAYLGRVAGGWKFTEWPALVLLLLLWQFANLLGFLFDLALHRLGRIEFDCQEKALAPRRTQ